MMLPTVLPLVFEFARHSERRAGWQVATGLLIGQPLALATATEAWQNYWFGTTRAIHFIAAGTLILGSLAVSVLQLIGIVGRF